MSFCFGGFRKQTLTPLQRLNRINVFFLHFQVSVVHAMKAKKSCVYVRYERVGEEATKKRSKGRPKVDTRGQGQGC